MKSADDYTPFLPVWVIYSNPKDYPGKIVLRCQYGVAGQVMPCKQPSYVGASITTARRRVPPGCVRVMRDERDEPQIVELWV